MAARLLDGRQIADKIRVDLARQVSDLKARYKRSPRLVSIQIGKNPSSEVYIKSQKNISARLGIDYENKIFDRSVSDADLDGSIASLSNDSAVTGLILQLPVPGVIDASRVIDIIGPLKDAEGVHPKNLGLVLSGKHSIAPCTATAVMEILASTGIDLYGKEAVVVGHSDIVGKPVALMLVNKFATTTVCHIATSQKGKLADHINRAEVLVVAVGKAAVVKGDWIQEGAVVIDVGINRVEGKIVGDIEFDRACKRASFITPVPGGVGPLTTTMLMRNTVELFKMQCQASGVKVK